MAKTLTTICLTAFVILFSLVNFDHIPIYFFWGPPVNIRLVFVIAIAICLGYLIRHFTAIEREEKLKKQILKMMREKQASKNLPRRRRKGSVDIDQDFDF